MWLNFLERFYEKHETGLQFGAIIGTPVLVFMVAYILSTMMPPVGQVRYTGAEFVPEHIEKVKSKRRLGGGRFPSSRPSISSSYSYTEHDSWYIVISDEKDKTFRRKITQFQYGNTDYFKDKIWPNYGAFKKDFREFKKLYDDNSPGFSISGVQLILYAFVSVLVLLASMPVLLLVLWVSRAIRKKSRRKKLKRKRR
jgi:hypothetical protein